jgi:hypothetical protein
VIEAADLPADPVAFFEAAYERGWTDGLPVIPATEERVRAMLGGLAPDISLGPMPLSGAELTHHLLAVNGVMAGCRPDAFPALLAAAAAVLDPAFNLLGVQATTHPAGPVLVFNGPIRLDLGIAAGAGCLGPGTRANLTIGRALRLALINVGGAVPGAGDPSTQGQPGKLAFVVAENEEESPWEPLAVGRAFGAGQSVVTVLAGEGPRSINDSVSGAPALIDSLAGATTLPTHNNWFYDSNVLFLLCPEHAQVLARAGLGRIDVQTAIFERARIPVERFSPDLVQRYGPTWKLAENQPGFVRLVACPEDVMIAVAGGAGRHSSFVASFGNTRAVSRAVSSR